MPRYEFGIAYVPRRCSVSKKDILVKKSRKRWSHKFCKFSGKHQSLVFFLIKLNLHNRFCDSCFRWLIFQNTCLTNHLCLTDAVAVNINKWGSIVWARVLFFFCVCVVFNKACVLRKQKNTNLIKCKFWYQQNQ